MARSARDGSRRRGRHAAARSPTCSRCCGCCACRCSCTCCFGRDNPAGAAWLLGGLGATDWVDGYLARRLGQVSEFGKKFDPTVDRLLFIVALVAIIIDDAAPIWFCIAVLVREVLVGGTIADRHALLRDGALRRHLVGQVATFLLMFAVPGFMLGSSDFPGHAVFQVASWLLGIPGLVLSWSTADRLRPEDPRAASPPAAAAHGRR